MVRSLDKIKRIRRESAFKLREEFVEGDSISIKEDPSGELSEED